VAVCFAFLSARRAQTNSLAKMAMPAKTMGIPGPGNISNAMPTNSTVPPTSATMSFFMFAYGVPEGAYGSAFLTSDRADCG
jgi:hypothetical protein